MTVQLVSGDTVVAEAKVAIALHDQTQLVVGVVSENPAKHRRRAGPPAVARAAPSRRSSRSPRPTSRSASRPGPALDRLVWQDADASALTPGAARRPARLGRRRRTPRDHRRHRRRGRADRLPGRPAPLPPDGTCSTSTRRSCARSSAACPTAPRPSRPTPASSSHGRALATSGDRVVAADLPLRRGLGDAARASTPRRPGSPTATPSTPRSGDACCPTRAGRDRVADRRLDDRRRRSRTCPAWPCRRSAGCSSSCSATSSSSAR